MTYVKKRMIFFKKENVTGNGLDIIPKVFFKVAFGESQLKEIAVEKLLKRRKPFFQKVMPVTAFLLLSMEWSHKKFFLLMLISFRHFVSRQCFWLPEQKA